MKRILTNPIFVAVYLLMCSCASAPKEKRGMTEVTTGLAAQASKGWFMEFLGRIGDRIGEIALCIAGGIATAVSIGVDAVSGGTVSLITILLSFAFRPAQNITNNIGGDNSTFGVGGGDSGMSFLEYVGLGTIIWLFVKYLIIPRPARNFWGGLIGMLSKKGQRKASFRKMISASGAAHTSKDTADVAAGKKAALPTTSGRV